MSLYGYPRQTTPNIERAANTGATVFHRHYASGSWTPPGTASLLTGTYPWTHRALHSFGTTLKQFENQNIFSLFGPSYTSFTYSHNKFVNLLFDQFYNHIDQPIDREELCLYSDHYSDALFEDDFNIFSQAEELLFWWKYDQPASLLLSRYRRSFRLKTEKRLNQRYEFHFPRGVPNSTLIYFTLEEAVDWIKEKTKTNNQPFLGYVHLLPPHYPYTTRADFVDRFRDNWQPPLKPESVFADETNDIITLRRHYDEFVGYVDAEFGRLFHELKDSGALENTYLIFTSDHGEMFERGIWQHSTPALYEPILHIPLMIWRPGQTKRIDVHTQTSCVDVLPTLLQVTGQPIPDWCQGEVLPTLGSAADDDRSLFAVDSKENSKFLPLSQGSLAHYQGPYKLTYYFGYQQYQDFYEFYNLKDDPEELNNLYPQQPSVAERMREELQDRLSESNRQFQR
jgi:arylsulfatase A-like enzyme